MDDIENLMLPLSWEYDREARFYSLPELERNGIGSVSNVPLTIRIMLESLLRNHRNSAISRKDIEFLANWAPRSSLRKEIPFVVTRVLMQDFTGVPALVDLAAMRDAASAAGADPEIVEPEIPVDLIIDHSVQVDSYGKKESFDINRKMEMQRNRERYVFLKWAEHAFSNLKVMPPALGICHQVNLEYLATCVNTRQIGGKTIAFPDTLIGTDSHTTMVNGIGVLGFGVGGIEAEAAMLGQPLTLPPPEVIGVMVSGELQEGVTATDLVLTLTQLFRKNNVVGKFIEFHGSGLRNLSVPERGTVSNMCPEYGATAALFPVDEETFRYLKLTGRSERHISLVRKYLESQGLLSADFSRMTFSSTIDIDLSEIRPSVSGPKLPQSRMDVSFIGRNFTETFGRQEAYNALHETGASNMAYEGCVQSAPESEGSAARSAHAASSGKTRRDDGAIKAGHVAIAAITSCTNTSNPKMMIAAALLARNAVARGLKVHPDVKTSLAPGSRVVIDYLAREGLIEPLEQLGFYLAGFGCTTCIGNSGPLPEKVASAIAESGVPVASVLSGNRNFEARIHPDVRANYLMSPPLVVAFAIGGSVLKDIMNEPLGQDIDGSPVYLRDIWPGNMEVNAIAEHGITPSMFKERYGGVEKANEEWNSLTVPEGGLFVWDGKSSYIQKPPYFDGFDPSRRHTARDVRGAHVLAVFGDSITTDHISPAGAISSESPAGRYLAAIGIPHEAFNTYGSRRGNDLVMVRGTFANRRIKNLLLDGEEGGYTLHFPDRKRMTIYDAAMEYAAAKIPLVIFAGREYGTGSSRDWAAKGPKLLGVRAVVAASFERIHRSNLVGMGILPLQFKDGIDAAGAGVNFSETIDVLLPERPLPGCDVELRYTAMKSGGKSSIKLTLRADTEIELSYLARDGILPYTLSKRIDSTASKQKARDGLN